ncbi:hypothetical protein NOV18_13235 [Pseudomonas asiatica]|uniref:Uncharacterized protein n=1 Tax=Pseudomonas asiatica TaxID=2219225 RepID=A0AAJ5ICX9_9PSED|nr:hypothetical protein [Pseudomonas asiatica]UUC21383.1 hypothetical protein NOV18_13235 [Pseudomonas asiatica]
MIPLHYPGSLSNPGSLFDREIEALGSAGMLGCWEQNKELLTEAVLKSDHPALQFEPGRVFDILLFMQQDPNRKLIAV